MEVLQTSALPLGYGAKKEGAMNGFSPDRPPRAGNGTRTRDPNLGKVVLYQLSYSRMGQGGLRSVPARAADGSGIPSQNARKKLEIPPWSVKRTRPAARFP